MINKTAFVVLSCDNYSDLWPIYIKQFKKNWPDCPFDKYISTNKLDADDSTFRTLKIGEDNSWSDGVIKTLKLLEGNYDYALIALEDLILIEKVDNLKFKTIFNSFIETDGNFLKFIRKPKPTAKYNQYFGIIGKGSLYRPTCVYSLWKIDVLLDLLDKSENAWQFERYGAVRSDKHEGFYVVYNTFFKVLNTVIKGKWVPKEKSKIKKLGYEIDSKRGTFSFLYASLHRIKTLCFNVFTEIFPWRFRRRIIFKLKRL